MPSFYLAKAASLVFLAFDMRCILGICGNITHIHVYLYILNFFLIYGVISVTFLFFPFYCRIPFFLTYRRVFFFLGFNLKDFSNVEEEQACLKTTLRLFKFFLS